MKHYQAIYEKAQQIGWPQHYEADLLVHDPNALKDWPESNPFAWSVRPCGTHLITVETRHDVEWAGACAKTDGTRARYFWWNGKTLGEVTPEEWVDRVKDEYEKLPRWRVRLNFKRYNRTEFDVFTVKAYDESTAVKVAQNDGRFAIHRLEADGYKIDGEPVAVKVEA